MSGSETHKQTQLLNKYLSLYQKNSNSRVFAPLAETYRKLGHLEKAKEILQKGLKKHNQYILGYIVLSNVYNDLTMNEESYRILKPFIKDNIDNLSLQKNFSDTCIRLNRFDEALAVNKYLLLLNPRDEKIAKIVKDLENKLEEKGTLDFSPMDDDDADGWVQKSFATNSFNKEDKDEDEAENWEIQTKPKLEDFKKQIQAGDIEINEHSLDDDFYCEEYDNENDDIETSDDLDPIITHTLVDLYLSQGFRDKALSVLRGILESHPNDRATLKKLKAIELETNIVNEPQISTDLLMQRVDALQSRELKILHNKFSTFLALIKNESKRAYEKNLNY